MIFFMFFAIMGPGSGALLPDFAPCSKNRKPEKPLIFLSGIFYTRMALDPEESLNLCMALPMMISKRM